MKTNGNQMIAKMGQLLGILLLAYALVLVGCGDATQDDSEHQGKGGTLEGSVDDSQAYEPCAGKTCGETCTVCDPADADCIETSVEKYCDTDGACTMNYPVCEVVEGPEEYEPCAGKTCGETCTVCDPADADCVETSVEKYCDTEGACTMNYPVCEDVEGPEEYEPCAGKTCGETCTVCDPADADCVETSVEKYCDTEGACTMNYPVCEE